MTKTKELIQKVKFLFGESVTTKLVVGPLGNQAVVSHCAQPVYCRSGNADAGSLELVCRLFGGAGTVCWVMLEQVQQLMKPKLVCSCLRLGDAGEDANGLAASEADCCVVVSMYLPRDVVRRPKVNLGRLSEVIS